jgi:hypothetical protein
VFNYIALISGLAVVIVRHVSTPPLEYQRQTGIFFDSRATTIQLIVRLKASESALPRRTHPLATVPFRPKRQSSVQTNANRPDYFQRRAFTEIVQGLPSLKMPLFSQCLRSSNRIGVASGYLPAVVIDGTNGRGLSRGQHDG